MTYVFKSSVTGNLTMLTENAETLLKMMGKTPSQKGIITSAQISTAIAALEKAIALEKTTQQAQGNTEEKGHKGTEENNDSVSLRQRAWPFLEMLKTCQKANADITWGV